MQTAIIDQRKTGNNLINSSFDISPNQQSVLFNQGYRLELLGNSGKWNLYDSKRHEVDINKGPYSTSPKEEFFNPVFNLSLDHHLIIKTKKVGDGRLRIADELFLSNNSETLQISPRKGEFNLSQLTYNDIQNKIGHFTDNLRSSSNFSNKREFFIFPRPPQPLSPDYGKKRGENIEKKIEETIRSMEKDSTLLENYLARATTPAQRQYYTDLINALDGDSKDLESHRNHKNRSNKIELYNRVSFEYYLEKKYNVNLTSHGGVWSKSDLDELDQQLKRLPKQFTVGSPKLQEINLKKQQDGVGGYNNGQGFISLSPKNITWALVHEIGHNFDNENPKWAEFKALSGWKNMTSRFKSISSDFINGSYKPYDGHATFRSDGKVYKDGDQIDFNRDGKIDGIVKIQYGQVMIHDVNATFYKPNENANAYSVTTPSEDFAETFKYFFENPQDLKKQCPKKYQFMVEFAGYDPLKIRPPLRSPLFDSR